MRVLVTASRDWQNPQVIIDWLESIANRPLTVVHGDAEGGDRVAGKWARETPGVTEEPHPVPDGVWAVSGPAQGFWRNQHMVDLSAAACGAFIRDNSDGATDCRRRAMTAEIPTFTKRESSNS